MKSALVSSSRDQASAFIAVPQKSLCMTLCLNGTVPVQRLANADDPSGWLGRYLGANYAGSLPGPCGPITIVLVL